MEYPKVKPCLNTSENDLVQELYQPCLQWASRFDRGVGYFTTGWLTHNVAGLSDFASCGGVMRLITSPILSNIDSDAIIAANEEDSSAYEKFEEALSQNVDTLKAEMESDILNAFSWMLYDGIIEMKFAIPCKKLGNGDFHDKFGIFYREGEALSFSGSINDSIHGFQNYESIKVFKTWAGTKEYVESDAERFNRLWYCKDTNLKIYTTPEAIKQKIFKLRTADRPYHLAKKPNNKWAHQDKAVSCFMEKEHGILAMATGTGKTVTAMKIINKLFEENKIRRVVITMFGNDLLDQWAKQMRDNYKNKQIYYQYESHKDLNKFIMHPDNAILLISRDAGNLSKLLNQLARMPGDYKKDTLFIFDEVHGAGSNSFVENLTGRISPYRYRLGLSATPEREYDDEGNNFIQTEIGEIIFTFSLEDAIRKGILCEFDYIPLPYVLTEEEKAKKKKIIAAFNAKKEAGEAVDETEMFTQLARINKIAIDKIDEFESFISHNTELLKKSIIFVQEMEYGIKLQDVLVKYTDRYHTYYADDEKSNLDDFAEGRIDCLLTCKKISEGIDISSVTNIFLFASDRSKLVTTQRIGRALRLDKKNPNKKATVIDFILDDFTENDNNADQDRKEWLTKLSETRRNEDEE
jgi:superfamily II DNA or RNA helicase